MPTSSPPAHFAAFIANQTLSCPDTTLHILSLKEPTSERRTQPAFLATLNQLHLHVTTVATSAQPGHNLGMKGVRGRAKGGLTHDGKSGGSDEDGKGQQGGTHHTLVAMSTSFIRLVQRQDCRLPRLAQHGCSPLSQGGVNWHWHMLNGTRRLRCCWPHCCCTGGVGEGIYGRVLDELSSPQLPRYCSAHAGRGVPG